MVKITNSNNKLHITSEYSSDFVEGARKLGGRWNATQKTWDFDPRDEERVRALLIDVYGTDGSPVKTCTVQIKADNYRNYDSVEFFGRSLVWLPSRDAAVRLHPSVTVIAGGYPDSGGSAKYPSVDFFEGTILEVKDVPLSLALDMVETRDNFTIVDDQDKLKASLTAEKEALLKRLAEIDSLLAQ